MATKKKDADEIIVELNRDVERLTRRVSELETELAGYKAREKDIADAMTVTAQAKAVIIEDAEKVANSMTHNAEKTAQATISAARDEAERIIVDAKAKAGVIIDEARAEAERETKAIEKRNAETIDALNKYAKDVTAHNDAINEAMVVLATKMYSYITKYRDVYERVSGKKFGKVETLPAEETPETGAAHVDTPEEYDNPEDLYHTMMAIEGRTPPSSVRTDEKTKDAMPETVPLTADMLGTGNPEEHIAPIIDMSDERDTAQKAEEEKTSDEKQQETENVQAQETEPAQVEEEAKEEDTTDDTAEEDELESMLTCFMDDLDKQDGDKEEPKKSDSDDLDDLLGSISGEKPKTPSDSEELSGILDELFGTDGGEGAKG